MHYVLGFDGGGTKTECRPPRFPAAGSRHNAFRRRPTRFVSVTKRRLLRSPRPRNPLRAKLASRFAKSPRFAQDSPESAALNRTKKCSGTSPTRFPNAKLRLITDLELSLASIAQPEAIVLVAGTGSSALGRDAQGHTARAGGHGPLLSDQGSAYDVGRLAVAAAVRERDRTGSDSAIGSEILRHLKFSNWTELRDRSRTAADEVFPRVFPVVAKAAEAGDAHAQILLRNAAQEITLLAVALIDRLKLRDSAVYIAKTGGMVSSSKFFDTQLDAELKKIVPHGTIGLLPIPPAEAAAHLALELISTNVTSTATGPHAAGK